METKNIIYYYSWDTGNYMNGLVIGFSSQRKAKNHAKKNYPKAELDFGYFTDAQIEEIYTGE